MARLRYYAYKGTHTETDSQFVTEYFFFICIYENKIKREQVQKFYKVVVSMKIEDVLDSSYASVDTLFLSCFPFIPAATAHL